MSQENERRNITFDKLEVRDASGDAPAKIIGHAAVFNTPADIGNQFREQVLPGAFADTIKNDDIRALFNHDENYVLGRNKAGTLVLSEDSRGLAIEVTPPDTQWARDLMTSIKRGDISGMSYGFRVIDRAKDQSWDQDASGGVLRTLRKVKVQDVSPVTFPAFDTTDVSVRSLEEFRAASAPSADQKDEAGYARTLAARAKLASIS